MKITHLLIVSTLILTLSCREKKEASGHGHEHATESPDHSHDPNSGHEHSEGADHSHEDGLHEQEEFSIEQDSLKTAKDSTHHTHGDGSIHEDH